MDTYVIGWILIGASVILSLLSRWYINHTYNKYAKVYCENGVNGAETARRILDNNGLQGDTVNSVAGTLTDHYNPKDKSVNLSEKIYTERSVASVAIAAHECGHAIQDGNGYFFLRLRHAMVPVTNIASYAGYFAIMIGAFASLFNLIMIGIACEFLIFLFQVVTLPVEFNASSRGLAQIKQLGLLGPNEYKGGRKVLIAAALTYVAAATTALMQVIRLLLIFARRRD
ncbi:MAG: zinc metallopeptidase [Clostridia bacterium]|nr:zinc metallopeptidase [Clostridia bacterium]